MEVQLNLWTIFGFMIWIFFNCMWIRLSLGVVLLVLSAFLYISSDNASRLELTYKSHKISITRDQYGIPKVSSRDFEGVLFGLGYTLSKDRLFQIHTRRMVASGRLSEMFGNRTLQTDIMFRQIGLYTWAKRGADRMMKEKPQAYQKYLAFVAGINKRISEDWLPLEFYLLWIQCEEWTVSDSLLVGKLLEWTQSYDYALQYIRSLLLQNLSKEQVDHIMPYDANSFIFNGSTTVNEEQLKKTHLFESEDQQRKRSNMEFVPQVAHGMVQSGLSEHLTFMDEQGGSNAWLIGGKHTKSGLPLLSNDPHMETSVPTGWYQSHISYQNATNHTVNMSAAFIPGLFLALIKSDYCAWGATTMHVDNQDLFMETIQDDQYLVNGELKKLKVRTQTIKIGKKGSYNITVRETHRGPLISLVYYQGKFYHITDNISLSWTGFNSDSVFYGNMFDFGNLKTHEQVKEFLRNSTNSGPPFNMLYITKDNHTGYQTIGPFPIRNIPSSGAYVKNGSSTADDWMSIPRDTLRLHIDDPEKGYVISCNNRPATNHFKNGIYDSGWQYTARADQIQGLLQSKIAAGQKIDLQECIKMQADITDVYCLDLLPKLKKLSVKLAEFVGDWNCTFQEQSLEASIYEAFYAVFQIKLKNLFGLSEHPFEGTVYFNAFTNNYISNLTSTEIIQLSVNQAINLLRQRFGQDRSDWNWGKLHIDRSSSRVLSQIGAIGHLFDLVQEGRGNINTLAYGRMLHLSKLDFSTSVRANLRLLFSYGQPSSWIIDTGASENPFSRHYRDQFDIFRLDKTIDISQFDQTNKNEDQL